MMSAQPPKSILFVCLGNICRSPLAEGVFRATWRSVAAGRELLIDSAGTGAWHLGSPPDPRSVAIAAVHGIDISGQRARKVTGEDFQRFDLVLGMDRSNVDELRARAPSEAQSRIHLFLDLAEGRRADVPDPYYGGEDGFAAIYRTLSNASQALACRLADADKPPSGHASSTM